MKFCRPAIFSHTGERESDKSTGELTGTGELIVLKDTVNNKEVEGSEI